MKHLVNTVELKFFQDDANGEYGLAHSNAIDMGFNAFYNAIGIFHDVFEHWFERRHKYFLGDAAFNIGGEMAAMGAAWYYYDVLKVSNRGKSGHFFAEAVRLETQDLITETIKQDYYSGFGDELVCNIPNQKPVENPELEYQIEALYKNVKSTPIYEGAPEYRERCREYKRSVTYMKIANLYRYGFRMAERLIDNNIENCEVLYDFIETWNRFCNTYSAEDLAKVHRGVTFRIYKDKGKILWTARFERMPEYLCEDKHFLRIPLLSSNRKTFINDQEQNSL